MILSLEYKKIEAKNKDDWKKLISILEQGSKNNIRYYKLRHAIIHLANKATVTDLLRTDNLLSNRGIKAVNQVLESEVKKQWLS